MITKQQQLAIKRLYDRSCDGATSYLKFRRRVTVSLTMGCLLIWWCNMWIGIETDGYTHS